MKLTGAQIVIRALREEGIRHGFGIPGTHNIELYDAMADLPDFTPVLVTDEQAASFMADGYARSSGTLALVNVVPGAGLTHAMSGIAEAYMDGIPMLVLACGIRRDTSNAFQLHDVDQVAIARPVCKKTYQPATHVELYRAIREACREAKRAPAGPVLVEAAVNLYLFPAEVSENELSIPAESPSLQPDPEDVARIVELIDGCSAVGIYAGLGAQDAHDELVELAERLDAVVFTTISGKGVFPEDHPRFAWNVMGEACPKGIRKIGNELDCLIAVGCRFGEVATASYGMKPPANLVHIDVDPSVFNRNYPAKLTLAADAAVALKALLAHPRLPKKAPKTARLTELAHARDAVRREQAAAKTAGKVSPHSFLNALQEKFGSDAVFVTDSGNGTFLAMEYLKLTKPRCFLGPIDYSCMGYSVPATIGAKMGSPERPVVGLIGDGAFLMTGMELLTAVNYGVPALFCILRDGELSQIAQFQRTSLNRETCTKLFQLDFEHVAAAVGMDYLRMPDDDAIGDVLNKAAAVLKQGKPALIEVNIDYARATHFSKGVVKTNFLRFPWKDRFRMIGRVVKRKIF
jgi:acetolactate synthase-1/2/3 large subunit